MRRSIHLNNSIMIKFIQNIKNLIINRELVPKFIAILLAVILWAYIGSTKLGEINFNLQIERRNLPRALVISWIKYNDIKITLKGKKEQLKNFNIKNTRIKAFVNLDNPEIGKKHSYPVEIIENSIPENLNLSYSPSRVDIVVEKMSKKLLKVEPLITGNIKKGYVRGKIKINPEYLYIFGPESVLKKIETIKTNPLSITNEISRIDKEIGLDIGKYNNIELSIPRVRVTVWIHESANLINLVKSITVKNIAKTYSYEFLGKKSVTLVIRKLNDSGNISKESIDVYVDLSSIDIDEMLKSSKNNNFTTELPIKVAFREKSDSIKIIYTDPERISIKIIKK